MDNRVFSFKSGSRAEAAMRLIRAAGIPAEPGQWWGNGKYDLEVPASRSNEAAEAVGVERAKEGRG